MNLLYSTILRKTASAILYFICTIFSYNQSYSQLPSPFEYNTAYISAAYGALTPISIFNYALLKNDSIIKTSQVGPVYLKYEKAISNNFGMGLNLAYVYNQWEAPGRSYSKNPSYLKRHSYSALVRFNYHLYNKDYLDLFSGLGVGFRRANWIYNVSLPDSVQRPFSFPLGFEFGVGAKYFLYPELALYLELGMSKSFIQGGITYSFRSRKYYEMLPESK